MVAPGSLCRAQKHWSGILRFLVHCLSVPMRQLAYLWYCNVDKVDMTWQCRDHQLIQDGKKTRELCHVDFGCQCKRQATQSSLTRAEGCVLAPRHGKPPVRMQEAQERLSVKLCQLCVESGRGSLHEHWVERLYFAQLAGARLWLISVIFVVLMCRLLSMLWLCCSGICARRLVHLCAGALNTFVRRSRVCCTEKHAGYASRLDSRMRGVWRV